MTERPPTGDDAVAMSDLDQRLQHFAKGGMGDVSRACQEAATELSRLRARAAPEQEFPSELLYSSPPEAESLRQWVAEAERAWRPGEVRERCASIAEEYRPGDPLAQNIAFAIRALPLPEPRQPANIEHLQRLRRDCSELYQVIETLSRAHVDLFNDPQVIKALDNASAARDCEPRPHDDLLPFTPPLTEPQSPWWPISEGDKHNG